MIRTFGASGAMRFRCNRTRDDFLFSTAHFPANVFGLGGFSAEPFSLLKITISLGECQSMTGVISARPSESMRRS